MFKFSIALCVFLYATLAQAIHYDVRLGTSNGAVAGSKITVDFYGDLDLAGKLPIDAQTGYKLFPGYFDDLAGGPKLTDDPGFQAFNNSFSYGEELHFRAVGVLEYWNPQTTTWGAATNGASITLYGGIPVDVWLNHMLEPANPAYAAQYQYYANGTVFSGQGVSGPTTALIDGASQTGSFHSHLDWKVSDSASAGVYKLALQIWSPTTTGGVTKYVDSDPFHVVFKTAGVSQSQYDFAFNQLVTTAVPEADTYAMLLAGLGIVGLMSRRKRAA
jgi:hypothetical protein